MMDRRSFFRLLGAGLVAPAVLPPPVKYFFAPQGGWTAGVDTAMAGASRMVVGRQQYDIVLDTANWAWQWVPIAAAKVPNTFFHLPVRVGGAFEPGVHGEWHGHPLHVEEGLWNEESS